MNTGKSSPPDQRETPWRTPPDVSPTYPPSPGEGRFDGLQAMAAARSIPVVSQHDYIIRQGGRIEDAYWPHNAHWSPTGHRWAAEALLEWLREHQDVCEPRGDNP